MVKTVVVRSVFEAIINKLPHRPANDDDSRDLFKKIVSKMQKGDIRKEIMSNLEEYFELFEELIVAKSTDASASSQQASSKITDDIFNVDINKLTALVNKKDANTDLTVAFLKFIEGQMSINELLAELLREANAPDLKKLWGGEKSCIEGLIISLAFEGARTQLEDELTDDRLCCLMAFCFLLFPSKRQHLTTVLLSRFPDGKDRVCLTMCFVGYVGFWGEYLRASDQVQWFLDESATGTGSGSESDLNEFGAEILSKILNLTIAPVAVSSKHRTSSGQSVLERLGCSSVVQSTASPTVSLVLFGLFCSRYSSSVAAACRTQATALLEREITNGSSVWETVHAQLSQVSSNMDTDVLSTGLELEQSASPGSRGSALLSWIATDEAISGAFVMYFAHSVVSGVEVVEAVPEVEEGVAGDVDADRALDSAMDELKGARCKRKSSRGDVKESVLDTYVNSESEAESENAQSEEEEEEEEVPVQPKRGRKTRSESESSSGEVPTIKRRTRAGSDLSTVDEVPTTKRRTRAGSDLSTVDEVPTTKRKTRAGSDLDDKTSAGQKQRWR